MTKPTVCSLRLSLLLALLASAAASATGQDDAAWRYRLAADYSRARGGLSMLVAEPGEKFAYGPSYYFAFGELLSRKLAPRGRPSSSTFAAGCSIPSA